MNNKYWSELTKKINPYTPGEQPQDKKYVKLNTNENPYPPSPKVFEAVKKVSESSLKLYPDPDSNILKQAIASYYKIDKSFIFTGNGSDEVLAFCYPAFFNYDKPVLFPDITYSFLPVFASLFNIKIETISLTDDFSINISDYKRPNTGIIIPNPNAPTGRYLELDLIREILKFNQNSIVIIDEAYIDFGGESAIKLVESYPNLLVVQTLSKSKSLAGLRLGFAVGQPELIEAMNRIKSSFNSYTIDRLCSAGAAAAFEDAEYYNQISLKIINTREDAVKELSKLGFYIIPSKSNFLFVKHSVFNAEKLYILLKQNGVLVRYFKKPRIDNYLRITIGTKEEMEVLYRTIKTIIL
ncbi:histidinol-phosphate transaminase [Candidatus Dependentiae bacterium]|nr:histidinol-phosphate transaminase [Candidatus Dependentiae bacterium]